ncbi:uncharacterized protein LOC144467604 [Augochlora pura]
METQPRYLEEQLHRKESEVSELHRILHDVGTKFIQLEQAFKSNLLVQARREAELDSFRDEDQVLRKVNGDTLQTTTELSSRLMNTIIERDHWKNTFFQQREFIMRNKIDYENAIASVKQECEDILKISRETTEKQFHELIELYNGTREKAQQESCNEILKRESEHENYSTSDQMETNPRNSHENSLKRFVVAENHAENENLQKSTITKTQNNEFTGEHKSMNACDRVFCIESHSNGQLYEEYIFKLSINREIKLKCPVTLGDTEKIVLMEFVNNEVEYNNAPLERIIMFFKNIYASVNIKQTGIHCGTQTARLRRSNRSTQTAVVGIKSFLRLNAGNTMLNSEKRAIERSLCNLERTVKTLKFNALNQARNIIDKDSQFRENNELFDWIQELSQ